MKAKAAKQVNDEMKAVIKDLAEALKSQRVSLPHISRKTKELGMNKGKGYHHQTVVQVFSKLENENFQIIEVAYQELEEAVKNKKAKIKSMRNRLDNILNQAA